MRAIVPRPDGEHAPPQDADRRVKRALSGLRSAAALDRAAAAADRERAAADRETAAIDRRQSRVDLAARTWTT